MIYRAVSALGDEWVVDDYTLRVGSDPPRPLPFRATQIRAGRDEIVCVPGEDVGESVWAGKTYLVRREGEPVPIAPWRALGMNPVAISDDGARVFLMDKVRPDKPTPRAYFIWSMNGLTGPVPISGDHLGFAAVDPVRLHAAAARTDLPGRALKLWTSHGPWVFGESEDVWYAFHQQQRQWFLVTAEKSPVVNLARPVNGRLIVACHGDGGGFVHEKDFIPITDAPEDIRIPTLVQTAQRIAVSAWFEAGAANFAEAGKGAERHPVTPETMGVFVDVEKSGAPTAEASALAARIGWPLYRYTDTRPFRADVPDGDIPLLYGYGRASRSVHENLKEIEADIQAVRNRHDRWALAISLHRGVVGDGFERPEQFVLDVAAGVWALAVKYRACHVRIFAYDRNGQDGCTRFPSFMRLYRDMQKASGAHTNYPRREVVTPDSPIPGFPASVHLDFPKGRRFDMADVEDIRGLRMPTGWDDAGSQPREQFLRSAPGSVDIAVDRDAPGGHEAVRLTRLNPAGEPRLFVGARFVASGLQLSVSPDRVIQTRPADAPTQYFETFEAVSLPSGKDVLMHPSGLSFEVVR